MNRIVTAELFVFLVIAGAIMAVSLYLSGDLSEAVHRIREFTGYETQ